MKFAFINAEKARWPVEVQCDLFGVSRSGYYAWKGRPEAPRTREDAEVVIEIKAASKVGREATTAALACIASCVHKVAESAGSESSG